MIIQYRYLRDKYNEKLAEAERQRRLKAQAQELRESIIKNNALKKGSQNRGRN